MNKNKQPSVTLAQDLEDLPKFLDVESRVFTKIGNDIYIGREKIPSVLRSLLRDEAKNIQVTRLWEILNASIINEAYDLALRQSTDFEQVQFAKALKHWAFFMMNVLKILEKNE